MIQLSRIQCESQTDNNILETERAIEDPLVEKPNKIFGAVSEFGSLCAAIRGPDAAVQVIRMMIKRLRF